MISPCQVADYWSLHLLDIDWPKLYGSSAGFDWSPKSSNLTDWPLPMNNSIGEPYRLDTLSSLNAPLAREFLEQYKFVLSR